MRRAIIHAYNKERSEKERIYNSNRDVLFIYTGLSANIMVAPSLSFQSQTNGGSKYPTMIT